MNPFAWNEASHCNHTYFHVYIYHTYSQFPSHHRRKLFPELWATASKAIFLACITPCCQRLHYYHVFAVFYSRICSSKLIKRALWFLILLGFFVFVFCWSVANNTKFITLYFGLSFFSNTGGNSSELTSLTFYFHLQRKWNKLKWKSFRAPISSFSFKNYFKYDL